MYPGEQMFDWEVKVPLVHKDGFVWIKAISWGLTEDEAFADAVRRFPFAQVIKPEKADDAKLVPKMRAIICGTFKPSLTSHGWCQACNQVAAAHPIYEGTRDGKLASAWMSYIDGAEYNHLC